MGAGPHHAPGGAAVDDVHGVSISVVPAPRKRRALAVARCGETKGDFMMRPMAIALVVLVAVSGALFLPTTVSASVEERSRGCVTYSEFKRAKTGMTKSQVAKLFGTNGKLSAKSEGGGVVIEMRDYAGCPEYSAVSIMFTNGKLDVKSQYGL